MASSNVNGFGTASGDESSSFKWDCIGRNRAPIRRDPGTGDQLEPNETEQVEYRQRQYVDSIKFTIVSVALLGVVCGAAVVYFLDNAGLDQNEEPIHYQQYNSYFGGLLRVVKVDGLKPDQDASTENTIQLETSFLKSIDYCLAAGYDSFASLFSYLRNTWNEHNSCHCPPSST